MYIIIEKPNEENIVYTTEEHGEDIRQRARTSADLHNRDNPKDPWKLIASEVWPPVEIGLKEYQEQALKQLSGRCKYERSQILSDTTVMNVLSGATSGYPEHLTPANVALMFEQYKSIYHTAEVQVLAAESKEAIDNILTELVFPAEEEILAQVEGA